MAAAKITLVLGSHAHVPYGAETSAFEKTYTGLVRPFISGLYKFPRIQAALHYSGVLLHWVERSHPEMFMLIEDMVNRKQIEMLGGGFYEPMLPIIPSQDKIGQIELLTTYLRKQFGKRPQGCWIPGFAWEQGLVSPLAACGMGFTFLGERQFALDSGTGRTAGAVAPCICEDQGKVITVFPVLQSLETAIAGKSVSSLLPPLLESYHKRQTEETEFIVSIFPSSAGGDQNESPDFAWCRFFEELSQCEHCAETIVPGKLVKGLKSLRKRSFPDSGDTAESISSRRFIIAHPEAGGIYAKMVFTNVLINQLRGDKSRKLSAHEELWKAQGSALFCKTGQEGLHNHLLRNAAYSALLGAERVTREKTKFVPSLVPYDFNMDGAVEWLFQDIRLNCYVQSTGGGIFELDYLPKTWNYLDTSGGRSAFSDRLLPPGFTAENLVCGAIDGARLCAHERYEAGETILLAFLTSFIAGLYLLLLWMLSPLCALEVFLVISIIPLFCMGSGIFPQLESLSLETAVSAAFSEAMILGALLIIFALIREPLGYLSLSLPGGSQGIVLLFSFTTESFLPIHLITSSCGALLLLGYFLGLYRYLKSQYKLQEDDKDEY